jgi:hypothetical protein
MSKTLIIVDVQKQFKEYIQHDLVDGISRYAETFDKVYQIWDTHNANGPSDSFPKQIDSIPKKFGKNFFSKSVQNYINQIEDETEEGHVLKLKDEEGYVVRVENNHDWFYVNPEIVDLINTIKGDEIILVGGAANECLEDVYQAFLAFGLNAKINKRYTYDAKTSDDDSFKQQPEVTEGKTISYNRILRFNDFKNNK